uniref:TFIIS-type domain-containing protein n=1 Tax=Sinocyclocheilus grahami TaxID=75366 RepID=A0A672QUZ2_SINGR
MLSSPPPKRPSLEEPKERSEHLSVKVHKEGLPVNRKAQCNISLLLLFWKIAVVVQTRSADEPMTTFVLCNECGNRWKVRKICFGSCIYYRGVTVHK